MLPKTASWAPAPEAVPELVPALAPAVALSVAHELVLELVRALSLGLSLSPVPELGLEVALGAEKEAVPVSLGLPEVQKAYWGAEVSLSPLDLLGSSFLGAISKRISYQLHQE